MKILIEFTEDELETLRCMVADSRMFAVNTVSPLTVHMMDDLIDEHDRMLARIEAAQEKLED